MDLAVDDDADDVRFVKKKYGHVESHGQPENPSVGFLKKQKTKENVVLDIDYVDYLKSRRKVNPDDPQEIFVEDVGDEPQNEVFVEGVGNDPQYELFLSNLEKHGSSYVLQADERIGLTKPLKYEECESDDEGQEDLNSLPKIQWRESEIDDDYAFFFEHLRTEGSNMIYQDDNSLPVVYNGQDQLNFQTDNGTSRRKRKLSTHEEKSSDCSEESNCQCGSPRRKVRSKFRVQIMRILSKPYDKEEHKNLMEAITLQKAQIRHIDLRSGMVRFCASNKKGKSYLDHHGDLKRKVQAAAKDDGKQLNLLRGFFFWIQNLTQEGSFIPWNDKECLAVEPQAC